MNATELGCLVEMRILTPETGVHIQSPAQDVVMIKQQMNLSSYIHFCCIKPKTTIFPKP